MSDPNVQGADCLSSSQDGQPPLMDQAATIGSLFNALCVYPIVSRIVTFIDTSTLRALAQTCHKFRVEILQSSDVFASQTLRCKNEWRYGPQGVGPPTPLLFRGRNPPNPVTSSLEYFDGDWFGSQVTEHESCVRDRVGECIRCEQVICRNCSMSDALMDLLAGRHRRICSICSTAPLSPDIDVCHCRKATFICQLCSDWWQYRDRIYRDIWQTYDRIGDTIGLYKVESCNYPHDLLPPATLCCWRGTQCPAAKTHFRDEEQPTELAASTNLLAPISRPRSWLSALSSDGCGTEEFYEVSDGSGSFRSRSMTAPHGALLAPDKEEVTDFMGKEYRGEVRSWCAWCDRVIRSRREEAELAAGVAGQ